LSLRLKNGVLLGVGAHGLTNVSGEFRVHRIRALVGAGYDLRAGGFELPILLGATVEPWWVANQELTSKQVSSPSPLLGIQLDVAPGYRVAVGSNGAAIRLAALASLGLSAELRDGVAVPFVHDDASNTDLFRLGGTELMAGIELGVWLPTTRR
jgi:hypothetical protein